MPTPNLLIVFADQMRAFSCAYRDDADPVITPNLDRFAGEGMTLTHAVSNFPVCSPFRAMLMTGRYPLANGVTTNCNSRFTDIELSADHTCFTDVLSGAGYSVGYIGKWHLEHPREPYVMPARSDSVVWNEYTPPHRRHGIGYWHGYNTYDNHFAPEYWIGDAPRDGRRKFDQWSPEHEADTAIEFLRNTGGAYRDDDKPFALVVSNNPPHSPYQLVPEKYVAQYGDATPAELLTRGNVDLSLDHPNTCAAREHVKNHFAMVTGVDDQFGRILAELRARDLERDTLVLFFSDHGEAMGSQNRMQKSTWFEESLRVPFIARWPGRIAAGANDDLLLGGPDIAPTVLGMLGLGGRVPREWQGCDYSAVWRGEPCDRPSSAYYINGIDRGRGVRTHRYTYARWIGPSTLGSEAGLVPDTEYLFDNHEDPYQLHNLANEKPALRAEMIGLTRDWLRRTDDPWDRFDG